MDVCSGSGEEPTSGPFSHPTAGRVDGYTRTDLEFGFHPMAEGVASLDLIIRFATDDVPPMFVRLEGMGGIVPIAVDKPLVDLRTCVLGQTYRDKIVIHNRGKTALKCSMKLKSSLVRSSSVPATHFTPLRSRACSAVPASHTPRQIVAPLRAMLLTTLAAHH